MLGKAGCAKQAVEIRCSIPTTGGGSSSLGVERGRNTRPFLAALVAGSNSNEEEEQAAVLSKMAEPRRCHAEALRNSGDQMVSKSCVLPNHETVHMQGR